MFAFIYLKVLWKMIETAIFHRKLLENVLMYNYKYRKSFPINPDTVIDINK